MFCHHLYFSSFELKTESTGLDTINEMMELMKNPDAMNKWFAEKKNEFDTLPEDK